MFIRVHRSRSDTDVSLEEPDDFKAFKVVAPDRDRLAETVASFGRPADEDEEHVFVRVEALKALAGDRGEDPEWAASLERMLAYASEHGWLDEHGAVRAHVEWAG